MWLCEGKLKVKTSHFRLPSASQKRACLSSLIVNGEEIEDVDSFVYLGAKVSTAGGADDDINSRLCKAKAVFGKLLGVDLEKQHPEQEYQD